MTNEKIPNFFFYEEKHACNARRTAQPNAVCVNNWSARHMYLINTRVPHAVRTWLVLVFRSMMV